jgi:hypothetical protein
MSKFSAALKGLLDDTNLFSREDWAEVLGIPSLMIEMWVQDKAVPPGNYLNMLVKTLETSLGTPEEPLEVFRSMALLRATEVSPLGMRMLPTVMEYMNRPFPETVRKLEPLSSPRSGVLIYCELGRDPIQ